MSSVSDRSNRDDGFFRRVSMLKLLLLSLGVISVGFAVYVAESYPRRKVIEHKRIYQAALPYDLYALEKYISAETMDYHYNKHDYGYETKLVGLVNNTDLQGNSLPELLRLNEKFPLPPGVYNNAGQLMNHNIFWYSMTPNNNNRFPLGLASSLEEQITSDFNSLDDFKSQFMTKGTSHFGSGWVWVLYNKHTNSIEIITTANGNYPTPFDQYVPLFNCDVWEHSYYIDYRNQRDMYLKNFWEIINWRYASDNYEKAIEARESNISSL